MNKNIKVIQLIDSLNPGGAEMMAVNIANGLAEKGIESHICTTRLEGDLKSKINDKVGYLFLGRKKTIDFKALKKLNTYIINKNITIIHAHSSSYFIAFLVKIFIPRIQIIWHNHYGNAINLTLYKILPLKFISYFFKSIISVNTMLNDWAKLKLKATQNYYLPNFADLDASIQGNTYLKGEKEKRIVCLANLRKEKDHLNLLKAFKKVHKKHVDWTLHLVGLDVFDAYSDKIMHYIKLNELNNNVFLYGSCNDIQFILRQATIGVLSSKSEGLPVALLEYGLSKLPVVVTDVGECSKVVTHEKTGLVVAPNNIQELANGLMRLINGGAASIAFGKKLHHEIQLNYAKDTYIKTLLSIYKSE